MAHRVSNAGFPEIDLVAGMKLRLEARSTATDAAVTGVTATLWAIYGLQVSDTPTTDTVPLYTALEIGAPA